LQGERSYFRSERETVRNVLLKHIDIDSSDLSDTALCCLGTVPASDKRPGAVCVEFGLEMNCLCTRVRALADQEKVVLTPPMRWMLTILAYCAIQSLRFLLAKQTVERPTACSILARALNISSPKSVVIATPRPQTLSEATDLSVDMGIQTMWKSRCSNGQMVRS
jgi:hypothetical protein